MKLIRALAALSSGWRQFPFHQNIATLVYGKSTLAAFSDGYDFFNHTVAIPLRLCLTLPGLWIWLVHAKVVQCRLDKISNILLVEHKSYLTKQTTQCLLEEISDLEVTEVEKSIPRFLEGDRLTHIQVSFLRRSKEPISLTFIESSGGIDVNITQTYNRLSEFLSLD